MRAWALLALLALASCGADGRPTAPNGSQPSAGVALRGSTQIVNVETY